MGQLRAMCADFFAIDWTFDHHEPLNPYLSKNTEFDSEWPSINLVYKMQPITVFLSVNL